MQIKDLSQAKAAVYINEMDKKRDSFIEKINGQKSSEQ